MDLKMPCVNPCLGYKWTMSDDLHFKLRIPPELMDALKTDAEQKRRSVTSLILEFIEKGLQSDTGHDSDVEKLKDDVAALQKRLDGFLTGIYFDPATGMLKLPSVEEIQDKKAIAASNPKAPQKK